MVLSNMHTMTPCARRSTQQPMAVLAQAQAKSESPVRALNASLLGLNQGHQLTISYLRVDDGDDNKKRIHR